MKDDETGSLAAALSQNAQALAQAQQRTEQELSGVREQLDEERRMVELINVTGAQLASNLDLQSLVQSVTDAGTQLSGAEFGAFFYAQRTADGGQFQLFTLSGAPREAFEHFGIPRATALFGPTFRGEGVIRLGDVKADPRYGSMGPHHGMPPGHLPVCSYLAVPVVSRGGEVIGGLFFGHHQANVFSERSERLLLGIAAQAAIAIDNARLFEETRRLSEERARLLEAERQARAELERASMIKDEFLATLSHELRTPLNAVLGWSSVLLARADAQSEARRGLETIARNARAQSQLVDDLLDMNQIISGRLRLELQEVDLAQLVQEAIESVRPSAEGKSIQLRAAIEAGPTRIAGDPNRLLQIAWNLLSNAVKFTPKDGTVEVSVRRAGPLLELVVRDSGNGIPEEFLPHIFERFRQEDSSSTRRHGGLGLGLAIVKQLAELHGGDVRAESPGRDRGATFTVRFPVRELQTAPQLPPQRPDFDARIAFGPISLQGVRVLVIDDDADAREVMRAVLVDALAEVVAAPDASEGFRLVRSERPQVIVSDIGMPGRDGYQLIRDVRALPPEEGGRTPAIALTAFARGEDRARALLEGYQIHIAKPVEAQELLAAVRSLVPSMQREQTANVPR